MIYHDGENSVALDNVVLTLPLPVAVAHNAGAALLLCAVLALNVRLESPPQVAAG